MDSSGNRQVDPGGNQDQANNQENAISPQASKDDPLPNLPTPAQSLEPQSNIITAPSAQAPPVQASSAQAPSIQALSAQPPPTQPPPAQVPSVQALSIQAPPVQAPPIKAPSTKAPPTQASSTQVPPAQAPPAQAPSAQAPPVQAPSAQAPPTQAPSAQAPLALPSLTKAKELRQPSSYKPPQPAQQSLPIATTSTPPPLHMDQPIYDPCLPQNETPTKVDQNELHKAKPIAKEPVIWKKEHPSQGTYTTYFMDCRYRQQYQNPPPTAPFRPPISRKAI